MSANGLTLPDYRKPLVTVTPVVNGGCKSANAPRSRPSSAPPTEGLGTSSVSGRAENRPQLRIEIAPVYDFAACARDPLLESFFVLLFDEMHRTVRNHGMKTVIKDAAQPG